MIRRLAGQWGAAAAYPPVFRLFDSLALCASCLEGLPLIDGLLCSVCGRPMPSRPAHGLCGDCSRTANHGFRMNRSLLRYDDWSRRMIHLLKYRGDERLADLFARLLAIGYWRYYGESRDTLLTYVPLHPEREQRRGFNQAELLARGLSRLLRVPVTPLLVRVKQTAPLSRQGGRSVRGTSVADAFAPVPDLGMFRAGRAGPYRILLVDDIYTTGSTVRACARAIREHAAYARTDVSSLTLCR